MDSDILRVAVSHARALKDQGQATQCSETVVELARRNEILWRELEQAARRFGALRESYGGEVGGMAAVGEENCRTALSATK